MADLKSIDGVEIFSAGTWNGDTYTTEDLDKMVEAFNKTSESIRPFLKLGHDDEQKLLQKEGLPAAGWVGRLYRKGEKLLADFVDIPKQIYELIEKKAYRKVSSEIYLNVQVLKDKFDYMLGAVALLGAETPGVMNLKDIMARYNFEAESVKSFAHQLETNIIKQTKQEAPTMDPKQIAELELKHKQTLEALENAEGELAKFKKEDIEARDTIEKLENDLEETKKQYSSTVAELKNLEITQQVDQLISEGLITKAMRPYATALLAEEKKEYSFGEGEKEEKLSKFEVVKKIFKLAQGSDVNLEEGSEDRREYGKRMDEDKMLAAAEKLAKEKKMPFSQAYKEVMREQQED